MYRTETAATRAGVAKNHERGRALVPAFANVGAVGALANRVQGVCAHQFPQTVEVFSTRKTHPKPRRMTRESDIGLVSWHELVAPLSRENGKQR